MLFVRWRKFQIYKLWLFVLTKIFFFNLNFLKNFKIKYYKEKMIINKFRLFLTYRILIFLCFLYKNWVLGDWSPKANKRLFNFNLEKALKIFNFVWLFFINMIYKVFYKLHALRTARQKSAKLLYVKKILKLENFFYQKSSSKKYIKQFLILKYLYFPRMG